MLNIIKKIFELSKKRIHHLHNEDDKWWYKWNQTYIEWIKDELEEVNDEIKQNNTVYLEDELWDIMWNYFCLLHSLKEDKLIDEEKVFDRCYKKYSERLANNPWPGQWDKIKAIQKLELKNEHKEKHWN